MIIVSQDRKVVTNFKNIIGIQVKEHIANSDGEKDYELKAITEKKICSLGAYDTEERAKEVLEEIANAYSDFNYYKNTVDEKKQKEIGLSIYERYRNFEIYKMPLE